MKKRTPYIAVTEQARNPNSCYVQRELDKLAKSLNNSYQVAIAARKRDRTSWLLVRILRNAQGSMSADRFKDFADSIQRLSPSELKEFCERYGWR